MRNLIAVTFMLALLATAGIAQCQPSARSTSTDEIRKLLLGGEPDSAVAAARSALTTDTGNVDLLLALADAQAASGAARDRRATLNRILRLHPRSVEARIAIAEDFFGLKQLDSAANFAYSALAYSNRRSADAFYWVGRIHQESGRPDSALFYYRGSWTLLHTGDLF